MAAFCDLHLGKGVVPCKDTPNFIGNRIGCFFGAKVAQLTEEGDYTMEEVDALTGPLIGLPKSASFRLIDIVGLDVWVHVLRNLYEAVPHDPARELYRVPPVMQQMMERGWLGEKRGQGFYKRVGKGADKEIWALDRKTLEYRPAQKVKFPLGGSGARHRGSGQRLRALVAADDRAGQFLWKLFRDFVIYSARMVPEISDRIVEIDRAMRWGYAFALGPFELWDALGVPETVERMRREGLRDSGKRGAHAGLGRAALLRSRGSRRRAGDALLRSQCRRVRRTGDAAGRHRAARHQARARRGEVQPRSLAGGPGRRRALPGVPQQDERARRGHGADGAPARWTRSTAGSRRWWWPTTARTSASAPI